ncbi:zinc-binding dehydrogenase [Nocardia sp. NBC_00508]|uniref:zinc-binding dehydrogenase n=1 Tax=Nocardia sp. NBC_00508 TaxID=2975992 RepID=UPI002E810F15|nr:zinc-binding dehydrogenase [Nocardia sp. NBC_00508]WUD65192.1 zinc-binding dehydrogenase [Nocardia sp. NBC_00508]
MPSRRGYRWGRPSVTPSGWYRKGPTGGTGRYAVQLARLGGAHVIASTGDPATHAPSLRELGAAEIISGPTDLEAPVDGVIDLVGGSQLVDAYQRLSEGGTVVAVGHAAGVDETFPFGRSSVIRDATTGRSRRSSCWPAPTSARI